MQTLYTSGTVFHAFLGERLPDWKMAATLVRKIAENYRLPYYTISPTYSICREHGYIAGEHEVCPICGCATEVYSRITGYYRPLKNWNDGKAHEFADRKAYKNAREEATPNPKLEQPQPKHKAHTDHARGILLFASKTCPNCKIARKALDSNQIPYEVMFADEHLDLVHEFGITLAPTLVVVQGDSTYETIVGAGPIRDFAEKYPC